LKGKSPYLMRNQTSTRYFAFYYFFGSNTQEAAGGA
jgi:hypothetical protein